MSSQSSQRLESFMLGSLPLRQHRILMRGGKEEWAQHMLFTLAQGPSYIPKSGRSIWPRTSSLQGARGIILCYGGFLGLINNGIPYGPDPFPMKPSIEYGLSQGVPAPDRKVVGRHDTARGPKTSLRRAPVREYPPAPSYFSQIITSRIPSVYQIIFRRQAPGNGLETVYEWPRDFLEGRKDGIINNSGIIFLFYLPRKVP